jgi:hypothetical protein
VEAGDIEFFGNTIGLAADRAVAWALIYASAPGPCAAPISATSPWHGRRLPSSTTVSHHLASVARASPSVGLRSFTCGVVSSRWIVIQRVHEVLVWPQAPTGGTHLSGIFLIPARL